MTASSGSHVVAVWMLPYRAAVGSLRRVFDACGAAANQNRIARVFAMLLLAMSTMPLTAELTFITGDVYDAERERAITYRMYFDEGAAGQLPLIVISHDGAAYNGFAKLAHLGREYAAHRFIAVHLNHGRSATAQDHRRDRVQDVSFFLTALQAGQIAWPVGLNARPDTARVGLAGFGSGADTVQALAGASFGDQPLLDPRVRAVAAIAPSGSAGGHGAFDHGPNDNTWRTLGVPLLVFGADDEAAEPPVAETAERPAAVRLTNGSAQSFLRALDTFPAFLIGLPGISPDALGDSGSDALKALVAQNSRLFFEVYLRDGSKNACAMGTLAPLAGMSVRSKGVRCER